MPSSNSRQQFIDVATRLFAERGFYGVSIGAIADEVGLTKQALLHHFGTKEKLYGEVLAGMSSRFEAVINVDLERLQSPSERMHATIAAIYDHMMSRQDDARIIMRELLDNAPRAEKSRTWYLRPFLDALTARIKQLPRWEACSDAEAFAGMYQIIAAINYFAISGDTLKQMYGDDAFSNITSAYPSVLNELLD